MRRRFPWGAALRTEPEAERSFRRHFTGKCLPWDLINCVIWLSATLQHALQLVEFLILGCGDVHHGPQWFQGATASRWMRAATSPHVAPSPSETVALGSVNSALKPAHPALSYDQCTSAIEYPCSGTLHERLAFMVLNRQRLLALTMASWSSTHGLLLRWHLLYAAILVVYSLLFLAAFVLVQGKTQRLSARPETGAVAALAQAASTSDAAPPLDGQASSGSGGSPLLQNHSQQQRALMPPFSSSFSSSAAAPASTAEAASHLMLSVAAVPAWMPAARAWVMSWFMIAAWLAMLCAQLLHPAPTHLVALTGAYAVSSASRSTFAYGISASSLIHQYPSAYRSISTLLKWVCITACGMAVDRQLLGSFLPTWAATWRTYVESLLLQVVLVPLVLWYREGVMRRAFKVMWQQALEQQRSGSGGVISSLPAKLGHGAQTGAAVGKHQETAAGSASSDAGDGAEQGAAGYGPPDSALCAAVADAAAAVLDSASSNASANTSQPAAAAAAAAPAAAAGTTSLVSDAATKPASLQPRSFVSPAGAAVVSAAILRAAAQRAVARAQAQPPPSKLYASRGSSQVVHISIKTPVQHGAEFKASAQRCLDMALGALQPAARSAQCSARITGAAVLQGCVHVLLEVELLPAAAGAAPADLQGLAAVYQAALQQQLGREPQLPMQPGQSAVSAVAPAMPWEDAGAGFMPQELPWAALATPVCLAAKARRSHSVRVALLGLSPAELPVAPRVVVAGHCLAADGSLESFCEVLGGNQLWSVPAAAGSGRKLLSISGLVSGPAPGVLTLHLLPEAAAAAAAAADGGGQQTQVHPLASLPLLHLPAAPAEEVLQLFAGMVGQVLEKNCSSGSSGAAAADEPSAAREAYWNHYVPFVHSWRSLLLAVDAMVQADTAAEGVLYTAEGETSTYTTTPGALAFEDCPANSQEGDMQEQLEGISGLLSFLADAGMVECLTVALVLLQKAGMPVEQYLQLEPTAGSADGPVPAAQQQQQQQQQQQPAGPAAAGGEILELGAASGSSQDAQDKPGQQPNGSNSRGSRDGSAAQGAASKSGSSSSSSSGHALGDQLGWGDALLGFPDAATEAAYLQYRNSGRSAAAVDLLAGCVCAALWGLQASMTGLGEGQHAALLNAALLVHVLPLPVQLLRRRWYLQHRESILGVCCGAGRVLMAHALSLGLFGLPSLWMLHRCVLLMACARCLLRRPFTQQVRSNAHKPVLLLELMGIVCYAAAEGSSLQALLLGVLLNSALELFLDNGKRRVFLGMQHLKRKVE